MSQSCIFSESKTEFLLCIAWPRYRASSSRCGSRANVGHRGHRLLIVRLHNDPPTREDIHARFCPCHKPTNLRQTLHGGSFVKRENRARVRHFVKARRSGKSSLPGCRRRTRMRSEPTAEIPPGIAPEASARPGKIKKNGRGNFHERFFDAADDLVQQPLVGGTRVVSGDGP